MFRRLITGIRMALSMYTVIPLPGQIWDDTCVNLLLPSFPLVGIILGGIWFGLGYLIHQLSPAPVLGGALLAVIPFVLTGFLHLDGYMDTNDAILSRRPLEDKLRILKDPHTGAFAVISLVMLMILWYAACMVIAGQEHLSPMLILIPVLSRCFSAFATSALKPMPQSGYVKMYQENMNRFHRAFPVLLALLVLVLSVWLSGVTTLLIAGVMFLGFAGALAYAWHEFHGISGDLSGYALVISELCGLLACAFLL